MYEYSVFNIVKWKKYEERMYSIINYFNERGINYTASSSEPLDSDRDTYNAFSKSGTPFQTVKADYFWQVSFKTPVLIIFPSLLIWTALSFPTLNHAPSKAVVPSGPTFINLTE